MEGELYGQDQLEALLQAHRARPVEALVRELVDDVTKFARGAEQTDDRTVLAFQIR